MDPIHFLAESESDEFSIANSELPWGYHEATPYHRDPAVVESDFEVELLYHDQLEAGVERPSYTCAYCADVYKGRSLDSALRWWNAHECFTLDHREQLAALYDLGASLPQGHPFAPVVDGRQAA